jgi:uncharacterized membrane protein YhaH (DUF805 family)
MDWKHLYLSLDGRIGRQTFWIGILVLLGISIVLAVIDGVLGTMTQSGIGILGMIFAVISIYPAIMLYAKRWHDRNKSGWWTLIILVPFVGAIWFLVELGFLRGTAGNNDYGADPVG